MSSDDRRGLIVPVANPEGVAPLVAIALAASASDDPPPRVIALVNPSAHAQDHPHEPARESHHGREHDIERHHGADPHAVSGAHPDAPPMPTPALIAAADYARIRGLAIGTRAIWSRNPAHDIVAEADSARAAWILLGYHRAASGSDTMGGRVHEVFARAKALALNVGVFVQGTDRPFERVYAAVDSGPDGRAALELAVRIAKKERAKLRAILVADRMPHDESDLADIVHGAHAMLRSRFHADVLTKRSLNQLFKQTPGRLLIVGRKFAEEVGLPLDVVPGGDRCVIVVQGGVADPPGAVTASLRD